MPRPDRSSSLGEAREPAGAYVASIAVAGFRGIGPQQTLRVQPGPGLTLVLGRNGSGKSSFAEAFEVLLTGSAHRFESSAVFREGWRNLHQCAAASISAELHVAGCPGTTVVTRSWAAGAPLDGSTVWVQVSGEPRSPGLGRLGWADDLVTYKPFLAHGELEAMFGRPSELHDRLAAVLGLEELVAAQLRLTDRRKRLDGQVKEADAERKVIVGDLGSLDDERAVECRAAVVAKPPAFNEALRIATSSAPTAGGDLARLRQLAAPSSFTAESLAAITQRLREAAGALREVLGTESARARSTADLLDRALRHHHAHAADVDCPVCGRRGALDEEWHARSTELVARLRGEAAAADDAHFATRSALDEAAQLLDTPPALLSGSDAAVETGALREAWAALVSVAVPDRGDADAMLALADHVDVTAPRVLVTGEEVRRAAAAELAGREDRWSPLAGRVAAWVERGRRAIEVAPSVKALKEAEAWLKAAHDTGRNQRLRPIAERAQATWAELRHDSNVSLGEMRLTGTATRRQVDLDVAVDGTTGSALGVMSQGEVNALALSVFLPRATLPESPFRFVVIDDPVQAMDPAKVDGLARVLAEAASHRQVIVFTHDDRLPASVRRQGIAARMVQVQRRPGSIVEIVPAGDPASQATRDAWAVAVDEGAPAEIVRRVVPGLCRAAVEAALSAIAQRRLLREGRTHDETEAALVEATRLTQKAALAMFGDARAAGQVLGRLNQIGSRHADTFQALNRGAHGELDGDARSMVQATEKLVAALEAAFA